MTRASRSIQTILVLIFLLSFSACQKPPEVASPPSVGKFDGPTSIGVGVCFSGYNLSLASADGVSAAATEDITFTMSGTGTGTFYSDSSCTNATTKVTISAGQSSAPLYFKGMLAGVSTWTIASTVLPSSTLSINVTGSQVPTALGLTGPTAITAGICAAVFVVALKDGYGNQVAPSTDTTVSFSGLNSASLYTDPACTSPISSTLIPGRSSAVWLYLKDPITEALTLSASVTGLPAVTYAVSVNSGAIAQAVLNTPIFLNAGQCTATTVTLIDSLGNLSTVASATTVTLSGVNNGNFYSDAQCTTAITSTAVPASASSQTIYFQDGVAEGLLLATVVGALPKTIRFSTVVTTPTKFIISGPLNVTTGVCSAAYTVSSQDNFGNVANVTSTTTVNLTGGTFGKFYSDPTCSSVITNISMAAATSSTKFYFKDIYPEDLVLTASSTTLKGTAPLTVTSAAPSRIILTGSPSPTAASCVAYTATTADTYGYPSRVTTAATIALLGKGTGSFYSNNTCSSVATTVTIAAGAFSNVFYFKDNLAEPLVFTGTSAGLTGGSLQATVGGASATKIILSGSSTVAASACTPYTIQTQDLNSNPSTNQVSPLTVNLSGASSGAFFSDSGCSLPITSATVAAGSNSKIIYFQNATPQSVTLNAADAASALTTGTLSITVSSNILQVAGSAAISVAACTAYTVQNSNYLGAAVNVGSNLTVNLTGNGTGAYYTTNACTVTTTTATITTGTSLATFYYKNPSAQQITVTGTAASTAVGTLAVTVATPAPTKLALSGPATVSSGACSTAYTVTSQNVNSAASNVASNTTVTLIGSGSGAFYSDNTCTTPVTSLTIGTGTNSNNFYFKDNLSESLSFSATATGLNLGLLGMSVTSTAATQLALSGPGEVGVSTCSTAFTISSKDANGNNSNLGSNTTVNLATSGAGAFYSNSNCTTPITSATISTGTSAVGFYYMSGTQDVVNVTATSGGLSTAALGLSITSNAGQISLGQKHTCAVVSGGVKCWGLGTSGQLGSGNLLNSAVPLSVQGMGAGSGVTLVTSGQLHSCALRSGSVYCWGINSSNQLGDNTATLRSVPVAVQGLPASGITAILAGASHTCAVASGAVYCWGLGSSGQLGLGTNANSPIAVAVPGLSSNVTAIAAGGAHTCALMNTGTIQCMGYNGSGQLGDNTVLSRFSPVAVQSLSGVATAISTGNSHTCALITGGTVQCWGLNSNGQTGDGTVTNPRMLPVTVVGLPGVATSVVAGTTSTCTIVAGVPYCFGLNNNGELGNNTVAQSLTPVAAMNISNATSISLGMVGNHVCATTAGQIRCWGLNDSGQLGNGYLMQSWTPLAVQSLSTTAIKVAAGINHTCAVLSTGAAMCWGLNTSGQLGDNSLTTRTSAVQVTGLTSLVDTIAAGATHSCALLTNGSIQCWGTNSSGQFGNSSNATSMVPTAAGFSGVATNIAAGANHTCAVIAGGVFCTGLNSNGQLGNGNTSTQFAPVQVTGLTTGVTAVAAGASHTCAIVSGAVYCWGLNSNGQLGLNTTTQTIVPMQVQGLPGTITQITAGAAYTCAINSTGAAFCWGLNTNGQLGNNSTAQNLVPVAVNNITSGASTIVAGPASHTCALQSGAVYCWGLNSFRQLGLSWTAQAIQPTAQPDLTSGVTSIAVGGQHTCAVSAGNVYCWGDDLTGKLGDNAPAISSFIPVPVLTLPL